MKLYRLTAVLALAGLGCTGQIPGSSMGPGQDPGKPAIPGQSPSNPPVTPPKVDVGTCTAATLAKPRAWRLTNVQMKNTLLDVLGFSPPTLDMVPGETRLDGFANQSSQLSVAPLVADYYLRASDELAGEVVRKAAMVVPCPMAKLGTGTCVADFIKSFGLKMWRRPLLDTEVGKLSALYTTTAAQAGGQEAGLRNIVQGLFMSPNFLYRTEVGTGGQPGMVTYLTDYELASALSYMLWDAPPDAKLLELAAQGKLRDQAVLAGEARRLLGVAAKAPVAMHNFLRQWLQIENLLTADKDPTVYTFYNVQVAGDLMEETRLLMNSIMFDSGGDRSFKTLFTAPVGYLNARTAPVYGIANLTGTNLVKTMLNDKERRGILTSAAFMAAHSDGDDTALVSRGRYFREEILCQGVPPPNPNDAMFDPTKVTPDMTNRERLVAHAVNPACKTCHALFDGLGFAMENYDPIGRFRTMDKNKPVDPTGSVPLPSGPTLQFKNFVDLIDQLGNSPDVYQCFSSQYLSYATGRGAADINECERKLVAEDFVKSGYKMDSLVLSVVNSPSFMARKN
jgi:hypothetical protein